MIGLGLGLHRTGARVLAAGKDGRPVVVRRRGREPARQGRQGVARSGGRERFIGEAGN